MVIYDHQLAENQNSDLGQKYISTFPLSGTVVNSAKH